MENHQQLQYQQYQHQMEQQQSYDDNDQLQHRIESIEKEIDCI